MRRRFGRADADSAGFRTRENRREADLVFLGKVRTADLEDLLEMLRVYALGPEWRIAAIKRRIVIALKVPCGTD